MNRTYLGILLVIVLLAVAANFFLVFHYRSEIDFLKRENETKDNQREDTVGQQITFLSDYIQEKSAKVRFLNDTQDAIAGCGILTIDDSHIGLTLFDFQGFIYSYGAESVNVTVTVAITISDRIATQQEINLDNLAPKNEETPYYSFVPLATDLHIYGSWDTWFFSVKIRP